MARGAIDCQVSANPPSRGTLRRVFVRATLGKRLYLSRRGMKARAGIRQDGVLKANDPPSIQPIGPVQGL
jgi:hypothetical protein